MVDDEQEQVGELSEGLQVELFHPESDRAPGDTNIVRWGFDVHPVVFPLSLALIILFVAVTVLLGSQAEAAYQWLFETINAYMGWFYILVVNIFMITILFFAFSKYGSIRIGGVQAEKEFSDFSWMAMLFSAGMGIGLMFFSVGEPMFHFADAGPFFGDNPDSAQAAMVLTFFHWGFHPWAVYGLVGLGLAFFSFNRGLPLTFRSIFWPLLGERIYEWPGHFIDLVTVFATLFGLATSLGLGVTQINAGLNFLGTEVAGTDVPVGTVPQVVLIVLITAIATLSVAAGLDKGVRRLSEINLYLMFGLLGFVLLVGPTLYVMSGFTQNLGAYLISLPELAFFTEAYTGQPGEAGWQGAWTIFYWGWWIAWSPFVGMFIARISKGRTVREFVLGVLILPAMFSFVWLSTFGGAAIFAETQLGGSLAATVSEQGVEIAMFQMLTYYPLAIVSALIATLLVVTFFVTSSDSGSLVIDHLTSGGKHDVPRTQRIFWALTEGAVAAVLLVGGGLLALQTAVIATGLPFAMILLIMCYTVYLGLREEHKILRSDEFRQRIQQMTEEGEVEIITTDRETVRQIRDRDDRESPSDD
ncbi:BCCT family transporter [Natrinema sp. 1APR25-10V2]|uniref:BCCT family transporter n=1 Tax=Natrinema sp. 1APR25-10V2 TaxID=2951081 RepID=UPI0028760C6F|nr:BCCT family transporter [Natrinema sp. 1APR25-10V2]MDS0476192.1 BCCT family transporter [Natrinema sp. 1APR25-10V2]